MRPTALAASKSLPINGNSVNRRCPAKVISLFVDTLSMDNAITNNIGDTISIRRPPRVLTDELGRNFWMGDVDPYDLQLEAIGNFNPYDSADAYNPVLHAML